MMQKREGGLFAADCILEIENYLLEFMFLYFYIHMQCVSDGLMRIMGKCLLY